MIKQIRSEDELDRPLLLETLLGRKMLAYMKAYGPNYDFCRFYKVTDESGVGYMFFMNATMIICTDGELEATDELRMFVNMNMTFRVEGNRKVLDGLIGLERYQVLNRTIFELIPDENSYKFAEEYVNFDPYLPDVYKILSEGFPNISDFSLWYTDTSHRCRHGISRVFTYRDSTTASVVFDIENSVLIG